MNLPFFPRLSPAKQLAELSIRARLSKAKSDHERVILRARRMREEMPDRVWKHSLDPLVREMRG